jgi:DNA-binding IclR family transcriptional regulator
MSGRRRVVGSNQKFNLRHHAASVFFVVAHDMEGTSTLTIESHNLSERLSDDHLEALVEEVSETVSICIEESGSEALVGSVEEGEKLLLLTDIGDLSPLFLSGVNSSGVMGASVEEHNRSSLGLGEIL